MTSKFRVSPFATEDSEGIEDSPQLLTRLKRSPSALLNGDSLPFSTARLCTSTDSSGSPSMQAKHQRSYRNALAPCYVPGIEESTYEGVAESRRSVR